MLLKKNQEQLRRLTHEEKVKKLQKLTRVPLSKLQTNIAQSQFEQDDVLIPFSVKTCAEIQSHLQLSENNSFKPQSNKKKQYDQDKVNQTIKRMTKQLYSLSIEKQNVRHIFRNKQNIPQNNTSSISISNFSLQISQNVKVIPQIQANINNFYSCQPTVERNKVKQAQVLCQISPRFNQMFNTAFIPPDKAQKYIKSQKQLQVQGNSLETIDNSLKPHQSSESYISKRFSRSKRTTQQISQQTVNKKLKFNRSHQRNSGIDNILNKENTQSIYLNKKVFLTERLSYQHIPTHTNHENVLKKRKNIGKNFINMQNQILKIQGENKQNQNVGISAKKKKKYIKLPQFIQHHFSEQFFQINQQRQRQINNTKQINGHDCGGCFP